MSETLATAALSAIIGLVIGFFFNRWNREYITKKVCDENRSSCRAGLEKDDEKFNDFKKEVREGFGMLKGILLVIASGEKVSVDDLKDLLR